MLKLKLQYFGHLMRRVDSLEKTLMLEGIRGRRRRGRQRMRWLDGINQLDGREFEWTPGDGAGQGGLACWDSRGRKESDMTEQLNWTGHHHNEYHLNETVFHFYLPDRRCNYSNHPQSQFPEGNPFHSYIKNHQKASEEEEEERGVGRNRGRWERETERRESKYMEMKGITSESSLVIFPLVDQDIIWNKKGRKKPMWYLRHT